jgi:hypothetical protein
VWARFDVYQQHRSDKEAEDEDKYRELGEYEYVAPSAKRLEDAGRPVGDLWAQECARRLVREVSITVELLVCSAHQHLGLQHCECVAKANTCRSCCCARGSDHAHAGADDCRQRAVGGASPGGREAQSMAFFGTPGTP